MVLFHHSEKLRYSFMISGRKRRILIATDTVPGQINGVSTICESITKYSDDVGIEVIYLDPRIFVNFPLPIYPDVRIAFPPKKGIKEFIDSAEPDCIHILTEGPIGYQAKLYCVENKRSYSTSYLTHWSLYAERRLPRSGWLVELAPFV